MDISYNLRRTSPFVGSEWEGVEPSLAQLFHHRQASRNTMDYLWEALPDPMLLKNMEAVCVRLQQAREKNKRIVIVGDYDTDGATSISIMMIGLSKLGYAQLGYIVPHRFVHGYGLTEYLIPVILSQSPDIVITVDNGIQSVQAVDVLHSHGIEVIITDHHLPGRVLPNALIINPNQNDCMFPEKNIAGCGVAWYIMVALRRFLKVDRHIQFNDLTVLAALGTIADCVSLSYVNRILVQKGLELIRRGQVSPGLQALISVSQVDSQRITSGDIAFKIAPRLNAAGRLEDMSLGVQCLLATTHHEAAKAADALNDLNAQRRNIQETMQQQALLQTDQKARCHVLFDAAWHQGIIGLIAARIREVTKAPTIVFAWDAQKQCYKGSGRSASGVHLKHVLDRVSVRDPSLMINFGGHAQAVGLSLVSEGYSRFMDLFQELCVEALEGSPAEFDVLYDGVIPDALLDAHWFDTLYQNHPFGQGFEEPVFALAVEHITWQTTKGGHIHIQCYAKKSKKALSAWIFKSIKDVNYHFNSSGWMFFQYLGQDKNRLRVRWVGYVPDTHILG